MYSQSSFLPRSYMLLLVVLFGIRNVVARIVIPVGFDHTGAAYVNATIPAVAGERIVQVRLTPQYHAGADLSIEDARSTTLFLTNVSVHLPNEATSMYHRFFFAIASRQSPFGYSVIHIGIGCGSPLVYDYGSVDYIGYFGYCLGRLCRYSFEESISNQIRQLRRHFESPSELEFDSLR